MKKDDLQLLLEEQQINVSFTSIMTIISTFFAGLILTKYDSFDISIRVPVLFLIISVLGFTFSTLIFTNLSGEISRFRRHFKDYIVFGNILSEYFGVYLLLFSLPLIIVAVSSDLFLRSTVLISVLVGFFLYNSSKFSLMERDLGQRKSFFISLLLVSIVLLMFISQVYQLTTFFIFLSLTLLLSILIISYITYKINLG
ncbi:MAG: hypothetical protein OH319_04555 [Candidatus Parvarchaeota archaeon]|nr:hypothetical protein [Candidatus Jingweiarchaeum tengchongense]MCW1298673.1 hypothetical protein [Candidatus Jingweiarchaeum tengchongense]MCW1300515.1 hypothetical protein [Candidatus Jingweiarchaeum tengchongense]MCW1304670.1 hypothetical protein [Candidatus Jingweiarchaeum tengchongense]MCW1305859.1 hypothetical protein [Candidatus Jingweiarchaeum tengchongense]